MGPFFVLPHAETLAMHAALRAKLVKGEKMTLAFDLNQPHPQGNSMVAFRGKFEIAGEWKQVTIELAKMELVTWAAEKLAIDRPKISRMQFVRYDTATATTAQNALYYTPNDPLAEYGVLLDEIELVRKK